MLTATSRPKIITIDREWLARLLYFCVPALNSNGMKYPCRLYNLHSVDNYVKTKKITIDREWQARLLYFCVPALTLPWYEISLSLI